MSLFLVFPFAFFRILILSSAKAANRANHVLSLLAFGLERSVKLLINAICLTISILRGLPGIFKRLKRLLAGVTRIYGMRLAADHSGIGMAGRLPGHLIQLFEREVFISRRLLDLFFRLFARFSHKLINLQIYSLRHQLIFIIDQYLSLHKQSY